MPTVTVYDGVTPDLQRIASQLRNPRGLLIAVGGELRAAHAEHWYGRGPFYQTEVARYLSAPVATDTTVEITVGGTGGPILLHKISGGVVRPRTTKMLAIPANPEARSLGWPRHWSQKGDGQMEVVFGKGGVPIALALRSIQEKRLQKRVGGRGAVRALTGRIMYWLKKSVTHRPDPLALPDRAAVETRIVRAGDAYLQGVLAGHYARNAPRAT